MRPDAWTRSIGPRRSTPTAGLLPRRPGGRCSTPISAAQKKSTILRLSGRAEGQREAPLPKPRDGNRLAVQGRFTKDRVVAATLESDRDPVPLDLDGPSGLDEATVQLLRGRLLEAPQP